MLPSLPLVAGAMNVEKGMVATLRDAEMNEQVSATEAAPGSDQYASPTGEIKFVLPTCSTRAFAHSDTKGKKKNKLICILLPENRQKNDFKIILHK